MSKKLPTSAVAARYGKTAKTLDRWAEAGIIPKPTYICGYKYWDEAELDASDIARGQGAPRAPVAAGARPAPKSAAEDNVVDRPQGSLGSEPPSEAIAAPLHPITEERVPAR